MESSDVPPSSTPQTEEITSAEQSFGSLSETSNIDSSSAFQSHSDASLTGEESLAAEGVPKVVPETPAEDSSQLQLEQSTSLTESPAKVEVIIPVEDKPQDLPSDLAQPSQDKSQKEPQVQPQEEDDVLELTEEMEKLELDPNLPAFENIAQPHPDEKMEEEEASNQSPKQEDITSEELPLAGTTNIIESHEKVEPMITVPPEAAPKETTPVLEKPAETLLQLTEEPIIPTEIAPEKPVEEGIVLPEISPETTIPGKPAEEPIVPPKTVPEKTTPIPEKPTETLLELIEEPVISKEAETYLDKSEALLDKMEEEVIEPKVTASSAEAALVAAVAQTSLPSSSATKSAAIDNEPHNLLHHIKTIQFKDKKVGIVTQNENGPCPLVAIINVLLLRRQISLPSSAEIVTAAKLMEHIGDAMLESVPKNLSGESRLNYEQNMMDAMAVLPKLQTGLDVNVKFTGVRDFEYTPECIIFDLLRVSLFHGWLVDPQEHEVVSAIGQAGYNQLVEKVISQKSSIDADAATEALIIETFLERSASQLTYHGLSELSQSLAEDEIGVLFRNNHFSTIYKHQSELFQLVTDQGFLGEANVVWETLGSIDGDGQFVDCHFRNVPPKPESRISTSGGSGSANTSGHNTSALSMTAEQQIDHDFLVALSLQEEQKEPTANIQDDQQQITGNISGMSEEDKNAQEQLDLALARQLQEEEERQAAEAELIEREASAAGATAATGQSDQQASPRSSPSGQSSKNNKCTFL